MGCLKLAHIELEQSPLRCVWKSGKCQKADVNLYDYGARYYDPALGRFSTVDPALELYYDWSPYCYVGNNPIRRTDPTGMTWADSTAAEDLKASASRQIEQYEKSNERKGERIAKANDKGKYGRARRLQNGINRNNSAIGQLEASISQIDEMGANQNYTFEFQSVSGDGPHYVTQASNGNIVIQHSSTALQLHETRHAYQYMTDKGNNFTWDSQNRLSPTRSYKGMVNWGLSEQSAYRVQYAYNPSSMPSSSYGSPSIYLNYKWVGGISGGSYNKFLPYMKQYELINRMLYRKQQMDFYNNKL